MCFPKRTIAFSQHLHFHSYTVGVLLCSSNGSPHAVIADGVQPKADVSHSFSSATPFRQKIILLNGEKIANNTTATKQQINGPDGKDLNYSAASKGRLCNTKLHKGKKT